MDTHYHKMSAFFEEKHLDILVLSEDVNSITDNNRKKNLGLSGNLFQPSRLLVIVKFNLLIAKHG